MCSPLQEVDEKLGQGPPLAGAAEQLEAAKQTLASPFETQPAEGDSGGTSE